MPTFALKGNTAKRLHGSHSGVPVTIHGQFYASGPQPVDSLPEWVVSVFNNHPEIMQMAINTETGGVVYQRMTDVTA